MKNTALFLALLFSASFIFAYNNHLKIKITPTTKVGLKKIKPNKTTTGSDFITTWQTITASESITIPTTGSGYNYSVNWGDSSTSTAQTGNATHTYTTAGTYTVKITGTFPRIYFNGATTNASKIKTIEQWGTNIWTSMARAFRGCGNLTSNATDVPDLSSVTDMSYMFNQATAFNADISAWNTAAVNNMNGMFYYATSFNQNIGIWNTAAVNNMSTMFTQATAFNQDLSNWNVSSVTNMTYMFFGATAFNQNLDSWNVSNVTSMIFMFRDATAFNGKISNWNVSNVTDMVVMFFNATSFNQDLSSWDISSVTNMAGMFSGVTLSTANYDNTLIGWRTLNTSAGETAIPTGITFDGGNSQYCAGEAARTALTTTNTWTITDGGRDTTCTLGVNDFNQAISLKLYPNPATEMIYLNGDISKLQKLTIYSVQGKQVKSIHKNFKEINVKLLSSGIYFVELMTKEGIRTIKLIKE
ncbi:MAG: BspA family leucine-rich repeat surface protein [Flavobacteriaceae bacterium]|nr:BspA family leucine-rich repeat surface protein [Flavobacteriaceae bacterium]